MSFEHAERLGRAITSTYWASPYAGALATVCGIPVVENEWMPRENVYVVPATDDRWGRHAIVMHPFTAHLLAGSLVTGKPMSDLGLQTEAILHMVARQAEHRASAARRRLGDVVRNLTMRADHYHEARWCDVTDMPHAYEREGDGFVRAVWTCSDCWQETTDETLARARAVYPFTKRV